MHNVAIVDSSVLIALDRIGLLPLLCKVYSEIWGPERVKKEFGTFSLPCAVMVKSENGSNGGQASSKVVKHCKESQRKIKEERV